MNTVKRVGFGLILAPVIFLLFDFTLAVIALVCYFWVQVWAYQEVYKTRKFRISFVRIIVEIHWLIEKLSENIGEQNKVAQFFVYLPPFLFCLLITSYISSEWTYFLSSLLIIILSLALSQLINHLIGRGGKKIDRDLESEKEFF